MKPGGRYFDSTSNGWNRKPLGHRKSPSPRALAISCAASLAVLPQGKSPRSDEGLCGPYGSYNCDFEQFSQRGLPFAGYSGPIFWEFNPSQQHLIAQRTFDVQAGVPFPVDYGFITEVYNG